MYARDSLADQAFRGALALSPPEPIDWGAVATEFASTGALPSDDIERIFPVPSVQGWFERSGVAVNALQASSAATQLHRANSALLMGFGLSRQMLRFSFGSRTRDGVTGAARMNLVEIASSASRLRILLSELRGELLYQRIAGARHAALEELYALVHTSFYHGQVRRQALEQDKPISLARDFEPLAEVGSEATVAPTWLEEGLTCLADCAEHLPIDGTSSPKRGADPAKEHRHDFIRAVARIWKATTGASPSVTGRDDQLAAGKLAPFQIFHTLVCGHTCGLLVRLSQLEWALAAKDERAPLKRSAKRLGLAPLPSAGTLRRALAGVSI
jgi:hypothetical protein